MKAYAALSASSWSNKPHRRVVKRRTHSQAFELSKALPCTHGQTYVPTLLHTNPTHTRLCVFFGSTEEISGVARARSRPIKDRTPDGMSLYI